MLKHARFSSISHVLILSILAILLTCSAQNRPVKLSVLIVDGINNHDWEAATRALNTILTATGRFTAEVSTTPAKQAQQDAWDGWRPEFSRYQAVLVNFNGGHLEDGVRWPPEVERALEGYVRAGGG